LSLFDKFTFIFESIQYFQSFCVKEILVLLQAEASASGLEIANVPKVRGLLML